MGETPISNDWTVRPSMQRRNSMEYSVYTRTDTVPYSPRTSIQDAEDHHRAPNPRPRPPRPLPRPPWPRASAAAPRPRPEPSWNVGAPPTCDPSSRMGCAPNGVRHDGHIPLFRTSGRHWRQVHAWPHSKRTSRALTSQIIHKRSLSSEAVVARFGATSDPGGLATSVFMLALASSRCEVSAVSSCRASWSFMRLRLRGAVSPATTLTTSVATAAGQIALPSAMLGARLGFSSASSQASIRPTAERAVSTIRSVTPSANPSVTCDIRHHVRTSLSVREQLQRKEGKHAFGPPTSLCASPLLTSGSMKPGVPDTHEVDMCEAPAWWSSAATVVGER